MKKSQLFLTVSVVITIIVLFFSCTKPTDFVFSEASYHVVKDEVTAMENFSIALSRAACKHEEVRNFLKNESLKQFDNDYDILYASVKNKQISDLGTFRNVLSEEMPDNIKIDQIEEIVPTLTIYVADATWMDPNGFCAKNWNTNDCRMAVTYRQANGLCKKLFSNGYYLGDMAPGTIPGGAVLIIKKNERVTVSPCTKSGDVSFSYIDDAFNPLVTKQTKGGRYTGNYTTGWIEGQQAQYAGDVLSAAYLNSINPDIITSYNICQSYSNALQNDYIYYGMSSPSTSGHLRNDVRSKIIRFKISPQSFNALFDDAYGDNPDKNFIDVLDVDDNGNGVGMEPSVPTIYSYLWSEGSLEIHVRVLSQDSNSNSTLIQEYYYDVHARDLYTIKSQSIRREQWWTTMFKWYITWKYTIIARDETTLAEKWYYPTYSLDLPTWDLFNNSAFSIMFSEDDSGATTSRSISYTTKKANQITNKIGVEASLEGLVTVKNELGWTGIDEQTNNYTTNISWNNNDDVMSTIMVSYGDKYISNVYSSSEYIVKSYASDRITITILPCQY